MNAKATQSDIEDFLAVASPNVPPSFIDFHREHGAVKMDIESVGSGLVWLWPLRDVLRCSREYGFDEFTPGLLGIGTDGCGELYAMDIRSSSFNAVGNIPATSLQWDDLRNLSASFAAFAQIVMSGSPIVEAEIEPQPPPDA